jgi:hypothetical protein
MSICNKVYTNVDQGRLHIAFDEHYQGSINSYNNFFTKFFAKLFRLSVDVTINSKTRRLNTKDYINFLTSHGIANATPKTIRSFTYLTPGSMPIHSRNLGPMVNHLRPEKVQSLTNKILSAIHAGDQNRALKQLGRGADPNRLFWIRGYDRAFLYHDICQGLPCHAISPFESVQYTPLLYARERGQSEIFQQLLRFGANPAVRGQVVRCQRAIADVRVQNTLEPTVRTHVVVDHHHQRWHHPDSRHVRVVQRLGMDARTTQKVFFEDTYQKIGDTFLDTLGNYVHVPNVCAPSIDRWTQSNPIARVPIM